MNSVRTKNPAQPPYPRPNLILPASSTPLKPRPLYPTLFTEDNYLWKPFTRSRGAPPELFAESPVVKSLADVNILIANIGGILVGNNFGPDGGSWRSAVEDNVGPNLDGEMPSHDALGRDGEYDNGKENESQGEDGEPTGCREMNGRSAS